MTYSPEFTFAAGMLFGVVAAVLFFVLVLPEPRPEPSAERIVLPEGWGSTFPGVKGDAPPGSGRIVPPRGGSGTATPSSHRHAWAMRGHDPSVAYCEKCGLTVLDGGDPYCVIPDAENPAV